MPTPRFGVVSVREEEDPDRESLVFSHFFSAKALFNFDKKLDCPPCLNDNLICGLALDAEATEFVLVVGVGIISLGKSAPHISHCTMLGWFMKVHTTHALLSVVIGRSSCSCCCWLGDDDVVVVMDVCCLRTPQSSQFSDEAWFEKKQMVHAHTLPTSFCVAMDSALSLIFGSMLMIIFGEDLKNPPYFYGCL